MYPQVDVTTTYDWTVLNLCLCLHSTHSADLTTCAGQCGCTFCSAALLPAAALISAVCFVAAWDSSAVGIRAVLSGFPRAARTTSISLYSCFFPACFLGLSCGSTGSCKPQSVPLLQAHCALLPTSS